VRFVEIAGALLAAALLCCGGQVDDAAAPLSSANPGSTIAFQPTRVSASRYPQECGPTEPPWMPGDLFDVDVIGAMAAVPYTGLTLSFTSPSPAPVGVPLPLSAQPFAAEGTEVSGTWYPGQTAQGEGVDFAYSQGTDATEIDAGPFDSVTFTLVAMPSKDGDPLTVRLRMHFADGQILDETFSAPVVTDWGGCPAG
jgi:hypothetical protein